MLLRCEVGNVFTLIKLASWSDTLRRFRLPLLARTDDAVFTRAISVPTGTYRADRPLLACLFYRSLSVLLPLPTLPDPINFPPLKNLRSWNQSTLLFGRGSQLLGAGVWGGGLEGPSAQANKGSSLDCKNWSESESNADLKSLGHLQNRRTRHSENKREIRKIEKT